MKKPNNILTDWKIDKRWTLFLDRDGVINKKIEDDYVKKTTDFEWLPGVITAIKTLSQFFQRTIIVTNQQGVGKGLMDEKDLAIIHQMMWDEIEGNGGKLDAIYFASQLAAQQSIYRKPNIGMGLKAKNDFPDISLTHAIMIGDSKGDILFGNKLGMKTVWIGNPLIYREIKEVKADFYCPSLSEFTSVLSKGYSI